MGTPNGAYAWPFDFDRLLDPPHEPGQHVARPDLERAVHALAREPLHRLDPAHRRVDLAHERVAEPLAGGLRSGVDVGHDGHGRVGEDGGFEEGLHAIAGRAT